MRDHYYVYRLFGADGELLYVGSSNSVPDRLSVHRSKPWGGDIASWRVETFPSRRDALAAEAKAIGDEGPLHNVARPSFSGSGSGLIDGALAARLKEVAEVHRSAEAERDRLVIEAVSAGGTLRGVAALIGLTHVGVLNIVKHKKRPAA